MATTKDIIDDAELAKSYITASNLSDDYKRAYLKLINITTTATNGITPEEKIQKMTEAIQLLAVTQGMYMSTIDDRIDLAVEKANKTQCKQCKAMKHSEAVERKEHDLKLIEEYKKQMGITDDDSDQKDKKDLSWADVIKGMLMKPYIYVVMCVLVFSPYGLEMVKSILQFYSK